jgi:FkbM family methyltransferase
MNINSKNIRYAVMHPLQTLRYLKYRDSIAYSKIAKYIPNNPVILEAGAANGVNSVEMAQHWKKCIVHAFEPVLAARETLIERTKTIRDRVAVYPYALGENVGMFPMYISGHGGAGDSQSSSLLKPEKHGVEYSFVSFSKTVSVEVITLDQWASDYNVGKIDFMWLDMQGNELNALRGAKSILPTVKAIHMEVAHLELYESAPLADEVYDFMDQAGFKPVVKALFRIGGNVLFVQK